MTDRLTRILIMIPYIQDNPGVRVGAVAEYLGCDPETVIADLNAVLLCGVPPYLPNNYVSVSLDGDRIYVAFAEHFKRPVNLTFNEALALSLALRHLPLTRRGLETARRLRTKIIDLLPAGARSQWRTARRQLEVGPLDPAIQDRIALLQQAIEETRVVAMEYYTASRDEMTRRDIHPYAIIEHSGEWYVIAHCARRGDELPFRVDRVRRLTLLESRFQMPEKFDIEKYRRPQMFFPGEGAERVQLRIAPELARWIREEHPRGALVEKPDGSLVLTLHVTQPQWIISWALSHAGKVEILAPRRLRGMLVKACRDAAKPYG